MLLPPGQIVTNYNWVTSLPNCQFPLDKGSQSLNKLVWICLLDPVGLIICFEGHWKDTLYCTYLEHSPTENSFDEKKKTVLLTSIDYRVLLNVLLNDICYWQEM